MRGQRLSLCLAPTLAALFSAGFGALPTAAWHDHGHLLLTSVAKLALTPEEIHKIEAYLSYWEPDFPTMSTLVTSAVWMDKIICAKDALYCTAMKYFEHINIFDPLHYQDMPYNPQNIPIDPSTIFFPGTTTGSGWALKTVWASLKRLDISGNLPLLQTCNPMDVDSPKCKRQAKTSQRAHKMLYVPEDRGSPFSLSLHLRLLLHIFGDIHQPMHTISLYAKGLPAGDAGGNNIPCNWKSENGDPMDLNLHNLWDSMGPGDDPQLPDLTEDMLNSEAQKLVRMFPPEFFGDRLKGDLTDENFDAIIAESNMIAQNVAYKEFDWTTFCMASSLPYYPSKEYLNTVNVISKQQIAVGGYRLSKLLKKVALLLPVPEP